MSSVRERTFWGIGSVLALLVAVSGALHAGSSDPFDAANEAKATVAAANPQADPFAEANKARPGAEEPQPKVGPSQGKASPRRESISDALAKIITFKVEVAPSEARPGEVVKLTITGTPAPGYYTYPATQRAPDQLSVQLSRIDYQSSPGLKPLAPLTESPPEFKKDGQGTYYLKYVAPFTWSQDVLILPDAQPGAKALGINIHLTVCNKNGCTGPGPYPPLPATVRVLPGPLAALTPELQKRLAAKAPAVQVKEPPELAAKGRTTGETPPPAALTTGLWGLLGSAFVGAFLMLLTPCVFPMIPITVNFFLKQSEKEHHRPLMMASVYSGTIIILLTFVILVLGRVVIDLANDPWFNLALGAVLIFFALSLFGMYEVELPSALARFTSAREGQGGYLGALFMALTFTITSFTCTGPFLGAMLGSVAGLRPPFLHLVLGALVYSATFAAPFFVLALFPSLIRSLPKSGSWLNAVKVTMGFLELGAALKFLANSDLSWNPGNPRLFNYDTVLCAWIALSVATGLYLMGVFRLPHDDPQEHIGVVRMLFATIFFGLAVYLTPALRGDRPRGIVGENIIAFLPPNFNNLPGAPGNGGNGSSHLAWHLDYTDAWKEARRDNKLIFIDFTGVTCTNCRDNEANVFPLPPVQDLLKKYVRVQLYTDVVPNPKLSAAEASTQAKRNSELRDAVADPTNPTYIVLRPGPNEPFANGKLNGEVLDKRKGTIWDVNDFVRFLEQPQQQLLQPRAEQAALQWHANYPDAWKEAIRDHKPILTEFAGITNTTSVLNQRNVFTTPSIKELLKQYALVVLYTDIVPEKLYPPEEQAKLGGSPTRRVKDATANLQFQRKHFETAQVPLYVILEPLPNGEFREVRRFDQGRIIDQAAFIQFLQKPLANGNGKVARAEIVAVPGKQLPR